VLQLGPEFPALASTKMPDASVFSTIVFSVFAAHPSLGGHVQLSVTTSGRFVGSAPPPPRSVGAMKNWKHSVYVAGLPVP
jgi:hypothetical protein